MTGPEERRFGCAVCRRPLNRFRGPDGAVSYRHSLAVEPTAHDPVPRPAERITGGVLEACDFCSVEDTNLWLYQTTEVTVVAGNPLAGVVNSYGTRWNACPACADLLEADDRASLHAHALAAAGLPRTGPAAAALRDFVDAVTDALQPGRVLLPDGRRGTAPPLPAPLLPKIRDRLTTLLDTGNIVPGLPDPAVRARIAAGLPVSRLYAIDDDYTDMALSAAGSLPPISVTVLDVPAPFGFLTWAHPVDQDATAAMSWVTDEAGTVHVAAYRPLATTITGAQLQRLREQAGWLLPIHAVSLRPEGCVDAAHPAAVLVATWLLIAHRLSEAVSVPVAPPIRRAYTRAGRPAPDVRLVRLRPRHHPNPTSIRTGSGMADRRRQEPEFRWWVGAFVREQAHGPNHSLRKPVLVLPFVNGPRGRPVKASTTVRLLAAPAARPDLAPQSRPPVSTGEAPGTPPGSPAGPRAATPGGAGSVTVREESW